MAQQNIDLGTRGDNQTGDDLNAAGVKIQANFSELYTDKLESSDLEAAMDSELGNTDWKTDTDTTYTDAEIKTKLLNNADTNTVTDAQLAAIGNSNNVTGTDTLTVASTSTSLVVTPNVPFIWQRDGKLIAFLLDAEINVDLTSVTGDTVLFFRLTGLSNIPSFTGGMIAAPLLTQTNRNANGQLKFLPSTGTLEYRYLYKAGAGENLVNVPVQINGIYLTD